MLELFYAGVPYKQIAAHEEIRKDHSTIVYHLRLLGLSRNQGRREGVKETKPRRRIYAYVPPDRPYRPPSVQRGPGRCHDCGIKLALAPGHNCGKGQYFDADKNEHI